MRSLKSCANVFCMVLAGVLCGCMPVRGAGEKTQENTLSVMTYNIWDLKGRRPAVGDVVEVIRSGGVPDLVLLQEVRGEKMAFSLSEALGLPHCVYHGFNGRKYGVAIVSRYPLSESGFLDFKAGRMNRGALKAVMMVKGRKVRVCSVHLDRIESIKVNTDGVDISWGNALNLLTREMSEETVRSRSVDELLAWMGSDEQGSVIIGGDFNTVLFSRAIRRMADVYEDALWNMPDYFTGSYIKSTLAYAIIQKHDGHIRVQSDHGEGTTVSIFLPAAEKPAFEERQPESETGNVFSSKVLVMDDEEGLRNLAKMMLERLGCQVTTVQDGLEALETYQKHMDSGEPFDVVILDLTIRGGMGGRQTIKELFEIDKSVRAIVSSGYSNDPIMANYKEYGFAAAIPKPYLMAELERGFRQAVG